MNMSKQVVLMLVGSTLILINAALIAVRGGAIIISSYAASSIKDLQGDWGRIVFGIPSVIGGPASYFWLGVAVLSLALAVVLLFNPRRRYYVGLLSLLFALLSVSVGGGFIVGMILVIIGSAALVENKPIGESFLGHILRAVRLDPTLFNEAEEKAKNIRNAAFIVVFLNVLTGLGNGLYILTANKIRDPTFLGTSDILLKGSVPFDSSVVVVMVSYIGLGVIKWLVLSALIFLVASRIAGVAAKYKTVAYGVSLSYAPIALQLFLPLAFFNEPTLTGTWPYAIFFLSNIWMGIALWYAVMKSLDLNMGRALGIMITAASAYYTLNYILIAPNLPVTGITFTVQPIVAIEAMLSLGVLIGLALGAFPRREQPA
jgi:hypothetical protein